ncbi:hypothetical protein BT67DRAFT_438501 [Trichocladium antarcticum]|uniref:RNI-like protein n=1 Tax=Trichocladium antarcticum TaxID=1450529 RepID=A0AAN6ZH14_9PEZI|nr:hypothetical protein BT67DRAFT_438501 [Trichocladium antarcticum]
MARIALPPLYGIHNYAKAVKLNATCLWRSIIASSLEKTLLPYCCWIKELDLTSLDDKLYHLSADDDTLLFSPLLEKLEIQVADGLDRNAIVHKVAVMILDRTRAATDQGAKRAGLAGLGGPSRPTRKPYDDDRVSGISLLTSLTVLDGSVLTSDVARAIQKHCPAFKELEYFIHSRNNPDVELAAFLSLLGPNTLESFTAYSARDTGPETFKALRGHSNTLKRLSFGDLRHSTFESLHELGVCHALEDLTIDCQLSDQESLWEATSKQIFKDSKQWLQSSCALRNLRAWNFPISAVDFADILSTPNFSLTTLNLRGFLIGDPFRFYASLALQSKLRRLVVIIWNPLDADEVRSQVLADGICKLSDLRELQLNEAFTLQQLENICASAPLLETVVLAEHHMDDGCLAPLAKLSNLKFLAFEGISRISAQALMKFIAVLQADPFGSHEKLKIRLQIQNPDMMPSDDQTMVANALVDAFGGQFDVTFANGIDSDDETTGLMVAD